MYGVCNEYLTMASWQENIGKIVLGDLVLDCYSGSGTVAVACYLTGRRFIAVEKNAIYWEKSVARLAAVQAQPMLF